MSILVGVESVTFRVLVQALDCSDPLLSKHVSVLEKEGLIEVRKQFLGKRPQTIIAVTPQGRRAHRLYCKALDVVRAGII
ncbi:transcriptional regulator [Nesterenkonia ebinurensis]|uniref:transcriptional regulator n=1 Tax=Nesterenkonia ebinurensis TaxID=2608252 RepID=UPI00168A4093